MKKVLSSILISFVIFANLFAPFTVGINEKKIEINKNEAKAEYNYGVKTTLTKGDTFFLIDAEIIKGTSSNDSAITTISLVENTISSIGIKATLYDINNKEITKDESGFGEQRKKVTLNLGGSNILGFGELEPKTKYKIKIELQESTSTVVWGDESSPYNDKVKILNTEEIDVETLEKNKKEEIIQTTEVTGNSDTVDKTKPKDNSASMPACDLFIGKGTVMGCVAQGFYYVLFIPTSYLFALAGTFFDNTFAYSVQDTSYRSTFVVEGWGLVRDFCNMFFIFILLWVAIGTILDLHGFKTKETIINVVIIGLLINFSLFATQVIIDASNVMARVFYNSDTIKITEDGKNGVTEATPGVEIGKDGTIPLSAGLVNKVNPQNMIIHQDKVNDLETGSKLEDTGNMSNTQEGKSNMSAGTFILIVILACIVNIVGIIVFLSVGLIFVSRVIGLWLAMILAPLAFFTYIIPQTKGIKMIGWEHWWPDTLKMAFLAPVFMFFLYIILKFLQIDIISDPINKTGLEFFVATLIPFAFIMILMWKAKSIATDMSGELGQQITGAVAAGGGMLLGGAALGTAFLGRKTLGAGIAKLSRDKDAVDIGTHKFKFNKTVDEWKASGQVGNKPTWDNYKQANNVQNNKNPLTWLGAKLNEKQLKVNELDHATHEMDEAKKSAGLVDAKGEVLDDMNLSGADTEKLKTTFSKSKRSDVEANLRKGLDASGKKPASIDGYEGEEAYKAGYRQEVREEIQRDPDSMMRGDTDFNGDLTDQGKKTLENKLNAKFNLALSDATKNQLEEVFHHIREESKQGVNMFTRGFARSNKASYDIRNLSEVKAGKKDSFMSKIPTTMIAGIALGVRSGLKSSGVNHGQGQGDFTKDLSATLTEALKSVKIEVPKAPSGGGHGGGGGHDAHGGGGHH